MNLKCNLKIIFFLLFVIVYNTINAQSPDWIWAKQSGGTLSDNGLSIIVDNFDNVYTTGSFQGTADFDPGSGNYDLTATGDIDIFISKFDAAGNLVWAKALGGSNSDEGLSIAVDASGNIYTIGYFQGTADFNPDTTTYNLTSAGNFDMFISKLDNNGNFIWAKRMGGTGLDEPLSIFLDSSANIYTTGFFSGTADLDPDSNQVFNLVSAGGQDIFISKIDASGNFIWAKSMGGGGNERGLSISVDAFGEIFTSGYFVTTADFDPGLATYNLTSNGASDIFISKLNSLGDFIWAVSMGKTSNDRANSLYNDNSGNVYSTGLFSGTVDFDPDPVISYPLTATGNYSVFVSKLDSAGNFVWAKAIGGSGSNNGASIKLDHSLNESIYVAGYFTDSTDFDPGAGDYTLVSNGNDDIFIVKLDSSGNFNWAKTTGGTNADYCYSVALNSSHNIFIAGTFSSSSMTFGSTTITNTVSTGFPDIFVAKLNYFVTGIESIDFNSSLILYPNPTDNYFSLDFANGINNFELTIVDLSGKIIFRDLYFKSGGSQFHEINTSDYSTGMYFVRIKTDDFMVTKRLVITR